jgi:hypothetical protein
VLPRETRLAQEAYAMFLAAARDNGARPRPSPSAVCGWYVRPALEARRRYARGAIALAGVVAAAGCGGGERQDADEPEGRFPVQVLSASFPERQKLAESSNLVITVRNAGRRTIPNIAVTVDGFSYRRNDPDLADRERPRFVVNGVPVEIGGFPEAKNATPRGCDTAYVNTWACGPLRPDAQTTFRWSVTAVQAGPFTIDWRVAAGLDGKARAVGVGDGEAPSGSFAGSVSSRPPQVRIGEDGRTIVTEGR